jgi:uncharacterized protein (DUF1499 family)
MIHDVSTDADDPPSFVALRALRLQCHNGAAYSGLRGVAHQRRYPDIAPVICARSAATVFQAALAVVHTLQWQLAEAAEAEGRIEATATTRWWRFKDDVVIRIRADDGATRLDIRSASRIGSSDFGANAKRLRRFLSEIKILLKSNT